MKYTIRYSLPYDIYRYTMGAKDEKQMATFVKMLVDEEAYGIEVVPEYLTSNKVEDKKILITWQTKLDDGFIDECQIACDYERSAHFLYDEIAKKDKTVFIEMEQLTNE